jgi:hypothetical protein
LAPRERANKGERTRRIRVGGVGAREMEATLSVVLAGRRSGGGSIAGLEPASEKNKGNEVSCSKGVGPK